MITKVEVSQKRRCRGQTHMCRYILKVSPALYCIVLYCISVCEPLNRLNTVHTNNSRQKKCSDTMLH